MFAHLICARLTKQTSQKLHAVFVKKRTVSGSENINDELLSASGASPITTHTHTIHPS